MQRRNALREQIVPTNEKETAWARLKAASTGSGAENRLEEKVVAELGGVLMCLGGGQE